MSQKRKYVRRKKVPEQEPPAPAPLPPVILPEHSLISSSSFASSRAITAEQDEEYEMSLMIDIIKMQEREEREQKEKERQQKEIEIEKEREQIQRDALLLEETLKNRDHNIKEILRRIKIGNGMSRIENDIVTILEVFMETHQITIEIDNVALYNEICSYLGIGDENKKGTIRLPESVKIFARNVFVLV
jgi:hypothetical protein